MPVELKVPTVGESITEVEIGQWLKAEGDAVAKDEPLVEIETDKATVEVPAPSAGVLGKILKKAGEPAEVGETIAHLEEGAAEGAPAQAASAQDAPSDAGSDAQAAEQGTKREAAQASPAKTEAGEDSPGKDSTGEDSTGEDSTGEDSTGEDSTGEDGTGEDSTGEDGTGEDSTGEDGTGEDRPGEDRSDGAEATEEGGETRVMPAARRLLAERGLKASEVEASGPGGRLLKEDVLEHQASAAGASTGANAGAESAGAESAGAVAPQPARASAREEESVPMTPLRRKIAARLVEAQQNAALLTTFNEIDMSGVMALRGAYKEAFAEKYGAKLGFMSFFIKASVDALKLVPQINAEIRGREILYKNYYDIGVAVGSGKGLVVPVLKDAQLMSFAEIEMAVADFGKRARDNKLKPEELQGGTFTISNGGVYGSLLSTPIVNPPQSGVLGLHAIQERPVAVSGQVVIKPMMYVALSYDHRIVDGREAVTFLKRIKDVMETPSRMLLEV